MRSDSFPTSHRKNSSRVLVLGDDTRSFLSVVRSLGRMGLEVHVARCPLGSPALKSRYIRRVILLKPFVRSEPDWVHELNQCIQQGDYDLVVPCHDSSLVPLHHHRHQLDQIERFCLPTEQSFQYFFDKQKTHDLAAGLGIPVARQIMIHDPYTALAQAGALGFPLVVKPIRSVSVDGPSLRCTVSKASDPEHLIGLLHNVSSFNPVLLEQNFRGIGVGVEVLCRNGQILAAFQHERVHEPLQGGGSSYRRSVPLCCDLLDAAAKLMRAASYTGPAMCEFKQNRETGGWILIEVNARFWGSLPLTLAAGADFPRYLYNLLCLEQSVFPQDYAVGIYARNWLSDYYWFRNNLLADKRNPDLLTVPIPQLFAELRHLLTGREVSDTLTWDDPRPAFAEFLNLVGERVRPLWNRLPWYRKHLRHNLLREVLTCNSILFVCYGNICRSPFAEHIWNSLTGKQQLATSAGHYPMAERTSPREAVVCAKAFGINLERHRSSVLTASQVENAEVIVIFDQKQRRYLEDSFPGVAPKIHFLGAIRISGTLEIQDPFGLGAEGFRSTYDCIYQCLRELREATNHTQ